MAANPTTDATTRPTANTKKFIFADHPKFNDFVAKINESPYLVGLINGFSGTVKLGNPGCGTFFTPLTDTITIDPKVLAEVKNTASYNRFITLIGHEFGHAMLPNGFSSLDRNLSIRDNANNALRAEGVALVAEYRTARELGAPMWSDQNGNLKFTIDKLAAQYKGNLDDPAFIEKVTKLGTEYYRTMRPSSIVSMTYEGTCLSWACKIPSTLRGKVDLYTVDLDKAKPDEVALKEINGKYQLVLKPAPEAAADPNGRKPAQAGDAVQPDQVLQAPSTAGDYQLPRFLQHLVNERQTVQPNDPDCLPLPLLNNGGLAPGGDSRIDISLDQPAAAGARLKLDFHGQAEQIRSLAVTDSNGIFRILDADHFELPLATGQTNASLRLIQTDTVKPNVTDPIKIQAQYQLATGASSKPSKPLEINLADSAHVRSQPENRANLAAETETNTPAPDF